MSIAGLKASRYYAREVLNDFHLVIDKKGGASVSWASISKT